MAKIEPGIYRVVNIRYGTAITVSERQDNTIFNWKTLDQPSEQWLVRHSEEGYHLVDHVHSRYMAVDVAVSGAMAYLGCDPTLWEIVPGKGRAWKIKLLNYDLVLVPEDSTNGSAIRLRNYHSEDLERCWRFERVGDLPNDEPGSTRSGTIKKNRIGERMEQIPQQDKPLVELVGQLADQIQRVADQTQLISDLNQRNADQTQRIVDQQGEIFVLKRQIEEKDRELAQANREVKYLLAQAMQREEPPRQIRLVGGNSSGVEEKIQEEVTMLRDEVECLKGLVNQLMDRDNKMPNNMS